MFKVIANGEELRGKIIKYCNLQHGVDADEVNIICTEDNEIMMFDITEDGRMVCYTEQKIKSSVCAWKYIENELLQEGIITEKEVNEFKNEIKERIRVRDEKIREQRYKEYLKLKEEFECKMISNKEE